MTARSRLYVVLMLVLALGAAACSGGSEASDTADGESRSAANDQEPPGDSSSNDGASDASTGGGDAGDSSAAGGDSGADDGGSGVDNDGAGNEAPPRVAVTVDEAVASLGALDAPWPGPIFTEYVCDNVPTAHVDAVMAVIPTGEVFEFGLDGSCRLSTGSFALVITAVDAENPAQEYAVRQERLSGDQPIAGFGDEAVEIASASRQTMLILDDDIVWQLEGGHPDDVPREQFLALAAVLLTRFDSGNRIEAVAEPLTADELAQLTMLLEDWHASEDAYFDDVSTEDELRKFATADAAVTIVTSRRSNQRQLDEGIGGWTYQVQQLETVEASWFRGTSRGDVIMAAECVLVERGQPEGREPILSASTQTLRVIASGDQWFVDGRISGSGSLSGTPTCS